MQQTTQSPPRNLGLGVLWFCAGVSLAEIITGALLAPLGMAQGLAVILIGHIIGCAILFGCALLGALSRQAAMKSTEDTFGRAGARLFAVLNVCQLVGWSAVMIAAASYSMSAVSQSLWGLDAPWLWSIVVAGLIGLWVLAGTRNLSILSMVSALVLVVLGTVLTIIIFTSPSSGASVSGSMSFGGGIELAIIMPLSWLPLVADYTHRSQTPVRAALACSIGYFVSSCLMYFIGLSAAIFSGVSDATALMVTAGMSIAALALVLISTVTTTYLDVYSAAVSTQFLRPKWRTRPIALVVAGLGLVIAVVVSSDAYQSFLHAIGSVFAPMYAVLLTDKSLARFVRLERPQNASGVVVWAVGVALYWILVQFDTPVGTTLPTMILTAILYAICVTICQKYARLKGEKNT